MKTVVPVPAKDKVPLLPTSSLTFCVPLENKPLPEVPTVISAVLKMPPVWVCVPFRLNPVAAPLMPPLMLIVVAVMDNALATPKSALEVTIPAPLMVFGSCVPPTMPVKVTLPVPAVNVSVRSLPPEPSSFKVPPNEMLPSVPVLSLSMLMLAAKETAPFNATEQELTSASVVKLAFRAIAMAVTLMPPSCVWTPCKLAEAALLMVKA